MLPKDLESMKPDDCKEKKPEAQNEADRLKLEKELKEEKKRLKQSILIELGIGNKEKAPVKQESHP